MILELERRKGGWTYGVAHSVTKMDARVSKSNTCKGRCKSVMRKSWICMLVLSQTHNRKSAKEEPQGGKNEESTQVHVYSQGKGSKLTASAFLLQGRPTPSQHAGGS